jgi:hypothetical protein
MIFDYPVSKNQHPAYRIKNKEITTMSDWEPKIVGFLCNWQDQE